MGIYEKNNCRILGKGQWISNDDIKSGLNNNDLIIGGTGSGKTGGYVIPNIRQANGNMVITDTKSILYKKLGKELEKQGYDVSILDFVNPERSDTYNPLEYIRTVNHFGLADYNHKDIISLSRVLVPTRIKHDPFWEESARTVMAFLIAFTLEALREEDHCMSSIVELYRQLGMENGKKRFEVWCMEHPNSFAAKKYAMFCGVMNVDRTWGCISQFLAEALEPFDFREMEYIFGRTGAGKKINLSDLWEKKKVIFLNISDTDRYADRVANLFYTPYDILSNAMRLKTGAEKIIHKQEAGGLEDKKPCLCLRLYSTKQDGTKFVAEKSGLNQWNGVRSCYKKDKETGERIKVKETPRDVNELYIPYPSIDRNRGSFFPPRDTAFELRLPDGEWISAKVCQQDGKAIMSNPNNLLGKWLLRDVLELQEGTQITYEMLKEYGIDSVIFTKLDEGKYSIDFCELGTYEKVYGLEDIDAKNDVSDE